MSTTDIVERLNRLQDLVQTIDNDHDEIEAFSIVDEVKTYHAYPVFTHDRKGLKMAVSTSVPADHPLMKALTAYQESDEFKNSLMWATVTNYRQAGRDRPDGQQAISDIQREQHAKGSLWAAFERGFLAGRLQEVVGELERLIGVIDGLTLPANYSAENRHMDACSRAGIKTTIRERIEELQGKAASGPKDAAEQFVGTGRAIEKSGPR